ncbi:MAG: dihydrolipoyl dehydrogenase family protein, partial [Brevefilum sp.]
MEPRKVDTIVIGSGQGGNPLASDLAKKGQQVVMFERGLMGGTCLNYGCTPSKMLLASAHAASQARRASNIGIKADVRVDFPEVINRIRTTKQSWSEGSGKRLKEAGVEVIHEEAHFAGERLIQSEKALIEADTVVINTGESPFIPPIEGVKDSPYLTYQTVWELDNLPESMVIVGGGYVGVELGQAFASLGSQVEIIDSNDRPISNTEPDVGKIIQEQLEADGVRFHLNDRAESVSHKKGLFHVGLSNGDPVQGEALLITAGRKPNTDRLKASQGGVELGEKGHIRVNEHFQTTAEGVYAIGDVTGQPAFTHVSWEDHRRLKAILNGEERSQMDRVLGYTIFTYPQVGRAGLTFEEAEEKGYRARRVTLPLEQVARATEIGYTKGFYRMVIDTETDE